MADNAPRGDAAPPSQNALHRQRGIIVAKGGIPVKAVRTHGRGGPEQLFFEDAPVPVVRPGDVLVRVRGSACPRTRGVRARCCRPRSREDRAPGGWIAPLLGNCERNAQTGNCGRLRRDGQAKHAIESGAGQSVASDPKGIRTRKQMSWQFWAFRRLIESTPRALAPHTGHVSNFRRPVGSLIEPADGDCFQSDTREPLAGVHGGHPVWTRLELAKGLRNFRMRRQFRSQTARIAVVLSDKGMYRFKRPVPDDVAQGDFGHPSRFSPIGEQGQGSNLLYA
jgi:hypothetical protein